MIFNTSNTDMKYIFFFKCYVLRRYGFTLFGLKYKTQNSICYIIKKVCVWIPFIKLSETTSFININRNIFKIFKIVFNKKEGQCLSLLALSILDTIGFFYTTFSEFPNCLISFVQIIFSLIFVYAHYNLHFCLYLFRKASSPLSLFTYCFFRNLLCVLFQWLCFCFLFLDFLIKFSC